MINLSQYEIGQRFRDDLGRTAVLRKIKRGFFSVTYIFEVYPSSYERFICLSAEYDQAGEPIDLGHFLRPIVRATHRIPANTRRIPSIQLDPVLEKAV